MIKRLTMLCVPLLVAGFCSASLAADVERYVCPQGPVCEVRKVDYGAMEVVCGDGVGDATGTWVCEYEVGYACTRKGDGEKRSGGMLPSWPRVCAHLCGECGGGWKPAVEAP